MSRLGVRPVDEARRDYQKWAATLPSLGRFGCRAHCPICQWAARCIEAASIAYDMAVAAASDERIRRSVAW